MTELAQVAVQTQPITYLDVLNNALNITQTLVLTYLAVRANVIERAIKRG